MRREPRDQAVGRVVHDVERLDVPGVAHLQPLGDVLHDPEERHQTGRQEEHAGDEEDDRRVVARGAPRGARDEELGRGRCCAEDEEGPPPVRVAVQLRDRDRSGGNRRDRRRARGRPSRAGAGRRSSGVRSPVSIVNSLGTAVIRRSLPSSTGRSASSVFSRLARSAVRAGQSLSMEARTRCTNRHPPSGVQPRNRPDTSIEGTTLARCGSAWRSGWRGSRAACPARPEEAAERRFPDGFSAGSTATPWTCSRAVFRTDRCSSARRTARRRRARWSPRSSARGSGSRTTARARTSCRASPRRSSRRDDAELGLFEVDEAAFPEVARRTHPRVVVLVEPLPRPARPLRRARDRRGALARRDRRRSGTRRRRS